MSLPQLVAIHFGKQSGREVDKFRNVPYFTERTGAPILQDCLAYLDCRVVAAYPGGDHTIFVGQVEEAEIGENASPLLFFRGHYTTVRE